MQFVWMHNFSSKIPQLLSATPPFSYSELFAGNFSIGRTRKDDVQHAAYLYHQSTTPDTLGNSMKDSPTGLLGYILQFFHFGRVLDRKENAGARIENHIPRDVILDNVMLFWMTGSIGTSMRMYAETINRRVWYMNIDGTPSPVPAWITEPRFEIISHPYYLLKKKYPNLISYKILEFGGHFFPYEFPEFYANEILTALTAFRKIHKY
nr:juvenile hormone epoxide hydrolase-like [Plodia interpunctella]